MAPEDLKTADDEQDESSTEEKPLELDVKIDSVGACQRHITVTIPRDDIDRYLDKAYSEMMPSADVPGFRVGRAPRKLVESRFRKQVVDQVKGSLLMDALGQVTEKSELAAISEPDFDPFAIELPEEGPMTFEFDLEVRPEFDLPQWKGLSLERPVREFSDKDVDEQLEKITARLGQLVVKDGGAVPGDYLVTHLTFNHDGKQLARAEEEVIRIRPVLSFRDGTIENFDELMKGVKADETRESTIKIVEDAPNVALRGQEVTAVFEVQEVKQLELPELTPEMLDDMGGFESEAELRDAILDNLKRQLSYEQQRKARDQILVLLTESANWELPPEMLERQANRELQRRVLELRRSGFGDDQIRAYENELRRNSQSTTAKALKEHFVLERIAEEESVEDTEQDYDMEIALIAGQSGESPRRVRAQLEKRGLMDSLRNQIIERKVIDLILSEAKFKDAPFELDADKEVALDYSASGGDHDDEIPEAQAESIETANPGKPEFDKD
jgi:trigger factor